MKKLLIVWAIIQYGCSHDTLHKVCPRQCLGINHDHLSPEEKAHLESLMGVGQCQYGAGACEDYDQRGYITSCEGYIGPTEEICDGIDNDCDGVTDEDVEISKDICLIELGSDIGQCAEAVAECSGTPTCNYSESWMAIELGEEVSCDARDNDCDGEVDEGLTNTCMNYSTCQVWESCYACPEQPEEICDGRDNDCDGEIDEGLRNSCGECGPEPQEICNSIDDDCDCPGDTNGDGIICGVGDQGVDEEEDIFAGWTLQERVCYSGMPFESLAFPPCRAGYTFCIAGETICLNEQIPTPELCDSVDNDCNGLVDDGLEVVQKYDLLFVFDTSGSMWDEINAVASACSTYISQYGGNPNVLFAVAIMTNIGSPMVSVVTDFSDISIAQSTMASMSANGNGWEASLDSIYLGCDKDNNIIGTNSPNGLSWRPDATGMAFFFTDEPAQTYWRADGTWGYPGITSGQDAIDSCVSNNVVPYIWSLHPSYFEYIAQGAGGEHFTLSNNMQTMLDDLNTVIVNLCGE